MARACATSVAGNGWSRTCAARLLHKQYKREASMKTITVVLVMLVILGFVAGCVGPRSAPGVSLFGRSYLRYTPVPYTSPKDCKRDGCTSDDMCTAGMLLRGYLCS